MISARQTGLTVLLCLLVCFEGPDASLGAAPSSAEPTLDEETEFILGPADGSILKLAHGFLDRDSVRIFVDGHQWEQGQDFQVKARSGLVVPLRAWAEKSKNPLVVVRYSFLPVNLPPRRDLRVVGKAPRRDPETGKISTQQAAFEENMWQGGNLEVRGSKTVQVSSGNRREMTVDQNLRLTILGQLTDDISVRAFLSDDNLPVIPEGNTEELRDIDKVLVEMKAKNWSATLGDFVAQRSGSTYGNYRRKLQGFTLDAHPGQADFEVLAGSPRGLYRTLQIRGQEANQGPYFLAGAGGGANLFLVAGSERVTLDGVLLTRGADRDYTIDYVRGSVTFTYRRLITAESTIVVEYEQGEGPYGRTVVGGGGGARFTVPGVQIPGHFYARIIKESDNPQRLRTGEMTPDDESILAAAGDDPLLAVATGVLPAESGLGLYDEALENGKTIYIYNANGGGFNLNLFHVGTGIGDYELDFITETGKKVFIHKGDGNGNYLIGRPLDRPQLQSMATLLTSLGDTSGTHLNGEWNFGNLDLNQLSEIDNADNQSMAGRFSAHVAPLDIGMGNLSMTGFWEKSEEGFKPFQVHKTVFDYDRWGLSDRARRIGFLDLEDQESGAQASWKLGENQRRLEVTGDWGQLRHGENLKADQLSGKAVWAWGGASGLHREQSANANDSVDLLEIKRASRLHAVRIKLGPIEPDVRYQLQSWDDGAITSGRASGFRLEETTVGLKSTPGGMMDWRVSFKRGLADSLIDNSWQTQRDSRTYNMGLTSSLVAGMRLVGEGTLRSIEHSEGPDQTTRLGRLNLSGQWAKTASDWSLGYRLDNSRTRVLDRQIVFVGDGLGDYNENGDYMGPGLGDHDMVQAATDSMLATTSVVTDLHWRQGFGFLGKKKIYGAWSALTLASVEGRSTTDDVGGLLALNPSVIFDPDHTVMGDFNFSEELTFLQHIPTVDLRGKFDYRETMDRQFADHPEDRLNRGYQVNTTVNLGRRSSVRGKLLQRNESRHSTESAVSSRRSFDTLKREYELGFGYRPSADMRLNLTAGYITRVDHVSGVSQKEYALHPNARHKFLGNWTIQGDARVSEVSSDEPSGSLRPWFFPLPGRNVESSVRLSWEPSSLLDVGLSYFARKQGDRGWQHDVRLESTARF